MLMYKFDYEFSKDDFKYFQKVAREICSKDPGVDSEVSNISDFAISLVPHGWKHPMHGGGRPQDHGFYLHQAAIMNKYSRGIAPESPCYDAAKKILDEVEDYLFGKEVAAERKIWYDEKTTDSC